ncbi:MAG: SDR family oxidoreductase [Chloroflexota bacterium]|nr:SDR family oxidoreductase [Chloroflexota bacterium]
MRVVNNVALVTGAASGIGRATALLFAAEGAREAILDWNCEAGGETARLIGERGGEAVALVGDVSKEEDVAAAVRATVDRFGRLDILVNDAAIEFWGKAADTKVEDWDRVLAVDLRGVFLCCKHAIPRMLEQGSGAIVNIASVNGLVGIPAHAAYNAAKGGIIALTRQMAVDYGPDNIRVNCICPTTTETPMVEAVLTEDLRRYLIQQHPLRRLAQPEDVAYAALYLASDEASCLTGVILPVDGGWTAQ